MYRSSVMQVLPNLEGVLEYSGLYLYLACHRNRADSSKLLFFRLVYFNE